MRKKHNDISIIVLSNLFSFFMVFGYSYMKNGNWNLIFGSFSKVLVTILIYIIYYFIFSNILIVVYNKLKKTNSNFKYKETWFSKLFDKYPFKTTLIVILVCYLPYIISFYPAILSPDPSFQIQQFFGIRTKYSDYAVLINENVTITNHHPVLHTLLLGGCAKIGTILGSFNLGLFFYSVIQIFTLSSVLSYTIKYMRKLKLSYRFRLICLLIYSFVPVFPLYAMSAVKDVIFGSLIILYIINLNELNKTLKINLKDFIYTITLMIFICLFRNNGFYVILLSLPFLFFINRKMRITVCLLFTLVTGFYVSYSKVILPSFGITDGSIREILSIPFQQTARYIKEHEEDLTDDEIEKIDRVLSINDLASRYKPEISDPVKNGFNKYATSKDLSDYFKVWFKGLTKHPNTYIEATMNNTYGYFYPLKTRWYIYYKYDSRLQEAGFDYHYNNLEISRNILSIYGIIFPYIPIIGLIVNIGFASWMLFLMLAYLTNQKKIKEAIFLLPALISILICVASPVNAYFRYALPYIFGMPLMIGIFINKIRSEEDYEE